MKQWKQNCKLYFNLNNAIIYITDNINQLGVSLSPYWPLQYECANDHNNKPQFSGAPDQLCENFDNLLPLLKKKSA